MALFYKLFLEERLTVMRQTGMATPDRLHAYQQALVSLTDLAGNLNSLADMRFQTSSEIKSEHMYKAVKHIARLRDTTRVPLIRYALIANDQSLGLGMGGIFQRYCSMIDGFETKTFTDTEQAVAWLQLRHPASHYLAQGNMTEVNA